MYSTAAVHAGGATNANVIRRINNSGTVADRVPAGVVRIGEGSSNPKDTIPSSRFITYSCSVKTLVKFPRVPGTMVVQKFCGAVRERCVRVVSKFL